MDWKWSSWWEFSWGCIYHFHLPWEDGVPRGQCTWCVTVNIFITIILIYCAGWYPKVLDQWRSLTLSRFLLDMVKGYNLELRCHPLLFHNFRWFDIKAAMAHHPIIQKEVDDQIAKGATEPLGGGAGFCSMYFGFLGTLMVYEPYSILNNLTAYAHTFF